jgi:hypothetical protein
MLHPLFNLNTTSIRRTSGRSLKPRKQISALLDTGGSTGNKITFTYISSFRLLNMTVFSVCVHKLRGLNSSVGMGTGSFPGVNRPRRDVDHPPHLPPRLRKQQSYTSTPPLGLRGLFWGDLYLFYLTMHTTHKACTWMHNAMNTPDIFYQCLFLLTKTETAHFSDTLDNNSEDHQFNTCIG